MRKHWYIVTTAFVERKRWKNVFRERRVYKSLRRPLRRNVLGVKKTQRHYCVRRFRHEWGLRNIIIIHLIIIIVIIVYYHYRYHRAHRQCFIRLLATTRLWCAVRTRKTCWFIGRIFHSKNTRMIYARAPRPPYGVFRALSPNTKQRERHKTRKWVRRSCHRKSDIYLFFIKSKRCH